MKPGSVTVDLAAETGGNVETTVPGKVVDHKVQPCRVAASVSSGLGSLTDLALLSACCDWHKCQGQQQPAERTHAHEFLFMQACWRPI